MKNKKQLSSFVTYCLANPDERFWQALRNWSGYNYIFGSRGCRVDDYDALEDTFYNEDISD